MAESLARVWDDSERAKNAFAVLVSGRNPFHVGNKPRSMDINVYHDRTGHLSEPILRESARQQGVTLTGRMEPCIPLADERAEGAGGEEERRTGGGGPGPQRRAGDRHVRPVYPIARREPLHVLRRGPSTTATVASPRRRRCSSAVWWTWRTRQERR